MPDIHPSGSILAVNNSLKCQLLKSTRTPTTYTLSFFATPTIGDTVISCNISPAPTSTQPIYFENFSTLTFGDKTVTVLNSDPSQIQSFTTSPANIKVVPLTSDTTPLVSSTATTKGLMELLGVESIDYSKQSSLIGVRQQRSGIGNEQRAVMIGTEFNVTAWVHQRDLCFRNIIKSSADYGGEVYAELYLSDDRLIKGIFGVANLNTQIALDTIIKVTFSMYCQGLPTEDYVSASPSPSPSPGPSPSPSPSPSTVIFSTGEPLTFTTGETLTFV